MVIYYIVLCTYSSIIAMTKVRAEFNLVPKKEHQTLKYIQPIYSHNLLIPENTPAGDSKFHMPDCSYGSFLYNEKELNAGAASPKHNPISQYRFKVGVVQYFQCLLIHMSGYHSDSISNATQSQPSFFHMTVPI